MKAVTHGCVLCMRAYAAMRDDLPAGCDATQLIAMPLKNITIEAGF
jgi:hypothetical protein